MARWVVQCCSLGSLLGCCFAFAGDDISNHCQHLPKLSTHRILAALIWRTSRLQLPQLCKVVRLRRQHLVRLCTLQVRRHHLRQAHGVMTCVDQLHTIMARRSLVRTSRDQDRRIIHLETGTSKVASKGRPTTRKARILTSRHTILPLLTHLYHRKRRARHICQVSLSCQT